MKDLLESVAFLAAEDLTWSAMHLTFPQHAVKLTL